MPKTHPPYTPEFRRQMVDLVRAGRSPDELAREFEPTAQSICVGDQGQQAGGTPVGEQSRQFEQFGEANWPFPYGPLPLRR